MNLRERLKRWLSIGKPARTAPRGAGAPPEAESTSRLAAAERRLGYQFRQRAYLQQALVHRSHVHVTGSSRDEANERLEFLGDAVLGLVVNEHLYAHYPTREEGDLTRMKSLLVCGARLSEVATKLHLGSFIQMSRSEAATGGRQRSSILADTLEAVIGAVYLDGGLEAARGLIDRWLLANAGALLARRSLGNYKSRLQEMLQARYKSPPRYRILRTEGPDHDRVFTVEALFGGVILGVGVGHNKKMAEQEAARQALQKLADEPELLGRRR